ncbi:FMN-binding protein [Persephonella sp.]
MRFIFFLILSISFYSYGGLIIKPEDALKSIFGDVSIEKKNFLLKREQAEKIQSLTGFKLKSRIITVYKVKKEGEIIAYGILDTHKVRTKNEAVLYIHDKDCKIKEIEIIAFYEPPEYIPSDKWLSIFEGKESKSEIKEIPNITGATLSARVIKKYAVKSVAVCKTLFKGKE